MPTCERPIEGTPRHHRIVAPSPWFLRFAGLAPAGAVLDVACGNGRHGRVFLGRGHPVLFVDKDINAVAELASDPLAEIIEADLENGAELPFAGRTFAAVLVSNYLFRPLFPALLDALAPGGVLIYETFARGNEAFCRPRHPDHLLRAGELLDIAGDRLQVVAYEHGRVERNPIPGVVQRLCAVNDRGVSDRADGEPPVHPLGD